MKINLGNVVALLPYIQLVMQKAQGIKEAKGIDKKKVAIEDFAQTAVLAIESGAGQDVVSDPLVLSAVGSVIDAIKNLENVVESAKAKHAPNG